MASTRRLHGFGIINERKLLLALDFLGEVGDLPTHDAEVHHHDLQRIPAHKVKPWRLLIS